METLINALVFLEITTAVVTLGAAMLLTQEDNTGLVF